MTKIPVIKSRWIVWTGLHESALEPDVDQLRVPLAYGYVFDTLEEGVQKFESWMMEGMATLDHGWFLHRLDAETEAAAEWLESVTDDDADVLGREEWKQVPEGVKITLIEAYHYASGSWATEVLDEAWGVDLDDEDVDEEGFSFNPLED